MGESEVAPQGAIARPCLTALALNSSHDSMEGSNFLQPFFSVQFWRFVLVALMVKLDPLGLIIPLAQAFANLDQAQLPF